MPKLGNLEDLYELSPMQLGMLFHSLSAPGLEIYFEQFCYTFKGNLCGATLQSAWRNVAERHPALRSSIHWEEVTKPLQIVLKRVDLPWQEFDWRELPAQQQEHRLEHFLKEDRARGFDLSQAPLMRLTLIRVADDIHHFIISSHHAMCDGWSISLVFTEVSTFYDALQHGRKVQLEQPRPYRDYIAWLQRQDFSKAEAFWRETLKGFTAPTRLWIDRSPELAGSPHSDYLLEECRLSKDTTDALERLVQKHQLTLNTLVQGAWVVLLSRYSGDEDMVYGTTVSGRNGDLSDMVSMIGVFINTLPVRIQITPDEPTISWLGRLQLQLSELSQYEQSPLNRILDWSEVSREIPLFQSIFAFQNYPMLETLGRREDGLRIVNVHPFEKSNFPLAVIVNPGKELVLKVSCDRTRFGEATARRLLVHWRTILQGMLAEPCPVISKLPWLDPSEQNELLFGWNDTEVADPQDKSLQELFEDQVNNNAAAPAVIFEAKQITYGGLNCRANQLADYLLSVGVGPEVPVGLCLERSVEMIVGLLGIVKAGGVYLPLDPQYPSERLNLMLEEAQTRVIVTESRWLDKFAASGAKIICLDNEWDEVISPQTTENPPNRTTPDNLVYLIYTSGSTGEPKRIGVPHRAVVRLVCNTDYVQLSNTDRVAQAANASFDATTFEIWGALLNGAQIIILTRDVTLRPEEFAYELRRREVTTLFLTTALFNQLTLSAPDCFTGLRHLLFGGERVDARRVREVIESGNAPERLLHVYGPTETTTFATWHKVEAMSADAQTVPIGRPITHTTIYVLDSAMRPVPVGVAGEIYIGGDRLARGYANSPTLTAEKFVSDPFSKFPGARLYRTGDLARRTEDSELEFLGRLDDQLKIRGFRVEPGEVEAALRGHPQVEKCAVVPQKVNGTGTSRLIAYVVAHSPQINADALHSFLEQKLPHHLVPAAIVMLDALPLNANGKIEVGSLPAPDFESLERNAAYVAPRTRNEQVLADIWSQVLGVERVGVRDSFFSLGGDSILSIQVVTKASRAGLDITHRQIFHLQTLEAIAAAAGVVKDGQHEQGLVSGEVLLTPIQKWFFEQDFCDIHHFNQAVLVRAKRVLDPMVLKKAFERVLLHHDALRLSFEQVGNKWHQKHSEIAGELPFTVVDLSGVDEWESALRIEEIATEAQTSFRLDHAPLLRVVFFDLGRERSQRVLIVIHHLVIDVVSWQILFEDLENIYRGFDQHQEVTLPAKTISFKEWSRRLTEFAQSSGLKEKLPRWFCEDCDEAAKLSLDFPHGENTQASTETIFVSLSAEETRVLLQRASQRYRQIDVVFLAALTQAFSKTRPSGCLLVDLEGHGREDLIEGTDLSRTIGWFTTMFPLLLDLKDTADLETTIRDISKRLAEVPQYSIIYGVLRYLNEVAEVNEFLRSVPKSEVSFNYLGQLDQLFAGSTLFAPASEKHGPSRSPRASRSHLVEIDAVVLNGELRVGWAYSKNLHQKATIEELAGNFVEALQNLTTHLDSSDAHERAPAHDFRGALSPESIRRALEQVEFEGS